MSVSSFPYFRPPTFFMRLPVASVCLSFRCFKRQGLGDARSFETNTTRRRGDFFNHRPGLATCPFYPVTLQKSKCEALCK